MSTEEAFARVEAGVRALRAGRMAVVRDDAARENEGDLVLAAELATANALALMARLG
ncbi:MAG TPA: 3,4-dihydroxy-2-butanone-4-phosphate synthase, partial [Chloroflexota bacterium]|nr:3,4-dihydroxy-2-butanone-4-phosphate synthase [Chloroflexota bacterium]